MKIIVWYGYNLRRTVSFFTNNFTSLSLIRYKSSTMKFLNVAEKNDAAKNIALHLSRGTSRRREGLSQYNKIYEFEAEVKGQKWQMVMTSVSGHLLALDFIDGYKKWRSCSPLDLFDANVQKYCPDNYVKIKQTLQREVRSCDGLIIWTDCDREGENIGYEIIEVCTDVKKKLHIFRAKFSEITYVSVSRALANLEQPNKNISDAVDVRQELDLRIGAAFTRFQTLRLQKVFPSQLADSLISYGSCQFPTLGFVVERYRAIENFITESFWKLKVNHTMNNLSVDFTWERVRLFDRDACLVLLDICLENPLARVCNVITKPKSKWRPLPLDTVELEKLASRKLKINAKETMRLAEKLYTQGFISYPRTETNEFPKEMNLTQLVGLQTEDPNWGPFARGILDSGGPEPRQGNKSDKAHPPIHPTKYTNSLSGNEQRLYEFIVRSFLACCSRDALGRETTVAIDVAGERFSASGLMITHRNYLDVYPYDKWSAKEIHVYETGDTFTPAIDMAEGNTSPPSLLTEADLIALMEKHGIGTDATHADHIETIKSRAYVALADATHFVPGVLGMGLVEGYDAMGLAVAKPHLRAQLEADLRAICDGHKNPQEVLADQIAKYREVYVTVAAEATRIDNALAQRFGQPPNEYTPTTENIPSDVQTVLKCPKCGSEMEARHKEHKAGEFYIACKAYPRCRNAVWLPAIVKSLKVLNETCSTCGPNYKKIVLEWYNNSISHLYPPPYTACVGGCDIAFLDNMNIRLSSVKVIPETPRTRESSESDTQSTNSTRQSSVNVELNSPTRAPQQRNHPAQFQPPPVNGASNVSNQRIPAPTSAVDDENVICRCSQTAILLTVKKTNANYGKKFYKCAKEKDGCGFFLWAPENDTPQNGSIAPQPSPWGDTTQHSSSTNNASRGWASSNFSRDTSEGDADGVKCICGLACKKNTVKKEGRNKGRLFYSCPKDYGCQCKFFQWEDGNDSNTAGGGVVSSTSSVGRGRGRGAAARGYQDGGNSRTTRKCGICRQEGHTRGRCPNNNNSFPE